MIFLVDDDIRICKSLGQFLNDSGFKTVCYTDPKQCLKEVSTNLCDLLIVDYRMPEMNGLDFMKEASNISPGTPFLIITGYGDVPTAVRAMQTGAVSFLEKPIDTGHLLTTINDILNKNIRYNKIKHALTNMEMKVLKLIIDGNNNKDCAHMLNRSRRTIETHRANIMKKFDVNNIVDLIRKSSDIYK